MKIKINVTVIYAMLAMNTKGLTFWIFWFSLY